MAAKINLTKEKQINITHFLNSLRNKYQIEVQKCILFGSHAKGTERQDSDIDLAIVSPQFDKDHLQEMMLLFTEASQIDVDIEPYPLHPRRFKQTKQIDPLIAEIKKYGQELPL